MEQQGEQTYYLKLDILLTILQANRQTGKIQAQVSPAILATALKQGKSGRGRGNVPCTIELTLVNGQVTTAFIQDRNGQMLAQREEALDVSRKCGELSWVVRSAYPQVQSLSPTKNFAVDPAMEGIERSPAPARRSASAPPQLTRLLTQQEMERLPRRYRQVILLIDGKRGVGDLSRMLNCPPDQLVYILNELAANRLILFSHYDT